MLRNYLKVALKVLLRRKFYTFISLFGIAFTLVVLTVAAALLDHVFGPLPPETRAARAGKSASRSEVTVKMAQTISSGSSRLARLMAWQSSATPSCMASTVLASSWIAPRMPLMGNRRCY